MTKPSISEGIRLCEAYYRSVYDEIDTKEAMLTWFECHGPDLLEEVQAARALEVVDGGDDSRAVDIAETRLCAARERLGD